MAISNFWINLKLIRKKSSATLIFKDLLDYNQLIKYKLYKCDIFVVVLCLCHLQQATHEEFKYLVLLAQPASQLDIHKLGQLGQLRQQQHSS